MGHTTWLQCTFHCQWSVQKEWEGIGQGYAFKTLIYDSYCGVPATSGEATY